MKLEAIRLRAGRYAIRPVGALGTCGWIGGVPWAVRYVNSVPKGIPIRED